MKILLIFAPSFLPIIGIMAGLLLLPGCASPARSTAMVPRNFQSSRQHPVSVMLKVEGGAETEVAAGLPQISSTAFRDALVTAINESKLFASLRDQPPADYRLDVSIIKCELAHAFSTQQNMNTRWQLTRLKDNKQLLNEMIESSGKAKLSEALVGMTRAKMSLEKAGQENIRLGLTKVGQLDLQ